MQRALTFFSPGKFYTVYARMKWPISLKDWIAFDSVLEHHLKSNDWNVTFDSYHLEEFTTIDPQLTIWVPTYQWPVSIRLSHCKWKEFDIMAQDNKDVPCVDTRNWWPENKILQADALEHKRHTIKSVHHKEFVGRIHSFEDLSKLCHFHPISTCLRHVIWVSFPPI